MGVNRNQMKYYYTLIGKEETNGDYQLIFGDYKKSIVLDEKLCMVDEYKSMRIIKTSDRQADIDDAIDLLNTN